MFITRILSVASATTKNKKVKIALLLLEIAIAAFVYNETKNKLEAKRLNKNINKK
jgi:hypothetical protein